MAARFSVPGKKKFSDPKNNTVWEVFGGINMGDKKRGWAGGSSGKGAWDCGFLGPFSPLDSGPLNSKKQIPLRPGNPETLGFLGFGTPWQRTERGIRVDQATPSGTGRRVA